DAIADPQTHVIDSRAFGQRKDIDAFDAVPGGVDESLAHAGPRDDAGHADRDIRLERRRRKKHPGLIGRDQETSGTNLIRLARRAEIGKRLRPSVGREPEEKEKPEQPPTDPSPADPLNHDDTSMEKRRARGGVAAEVASGNCRDGLWRNLGS